MQTSLITINKNAFWTKKFAGETLNGQRIRLNVN